MLGVVSTHERLSDGTEHASLLYELPPPPPRLCRIKFSVNLKIGRGEKQKYKDTVEHRHLLLEGQKASAYSVNNTA